MLTPAAGRHGSTIPPAGPQGGGGVTFWPGATNRMMMTRSRIPVILVHGWNSHPGVWNRLIPRLDAAGIPYSRFSHAEMAGEDMPCIARALGDHLREYREETGYDGQADIVAHSLGACITRHYLEVADGAARRERVRQLIALGPPNSGSALAELFNDPEQGSAIIGRLEGVFVPAGFDPAADPIVQDVRPKSRFMAGLRAAGTRRDIAYRIIVTANPSGNPGFFPLFNGKTWERGDDGGYRLTLEGDGIVPNRESALPGIAPELVLPGSDAPGDHPRPDLFCHISQPRNPIVIDRILRYLGESRSGGSEPAFPADEPACGNGTAV